MEHTNTNQVMSEFSLKMSTDQFYDINHIYQIVHRIEMQFHKGY
jgi:transposase